MPPIHPTPPDSPWYIPSRYHSKCNEIFNPPQDDDWDVLIIKWLWMLFLLILLVGWEVGEGALGEERSLRIKLRL